MTTLHVVGHTAPTQVHVKMYGCLAEALSHYVVLTDRTKDRVVLFEMEVEGFNKIEAHRKAYLKYMQGDYVTVASRDAILTTELTYPVFVGGKLRELTAAQAESNRFNKLTKVEQLAERVAKLEADLEQLRIHLRWRGVAP